MPNYVQRALTRFGVTLADWATDSPSIYMPPSYGRAAQQLNTVDHTAAISPERKKRIQQIVGVFLYYARAVDPTMLTALNKIGSAQAQPTEAVEKAVNRFLQYAATWPNAILVYHASDMRLVAHSDASYLSESRSRSRAGGLLYLSNNNDSKPALVNGAIDCISSIIPSVVSSAFEAEYAALFITAQAAVGLRNSLNDLGYPQQATTIVADNECAVGVVNRSVKQRRSKAIDMRYHWIRDRVAQGQFLVTWQPGSKNLADFFTKSHPVHHQRAMRSTFVNTPPLPVPRDSASVRRSTRRLSTKVAHTHTHFT